VSLESLKGGDYHANFYVILVQIDCPDSLFDQKMLLSASTAEAVKDISGRADST
jgi:hypothetical protein